MIETIFMIFIKILAGIIAIAIKLTLLKIIIDMLKEKRNYGESMTYMRLIKGIKNS